jgi:hypothetical protein
MQEDYIFTGDIEKGLPNVSSHDMKALNYIKREMA